MKKIILEIKELIYLKPILAVGIFSLIFFFLGGMAVFLLAKANDVNISYKNKPERQKNLEYKFTSPLLDCNYEGGPFAIKADSMKEKIEKIINENINNGKVKHVSVYFRDLNNGPTIGIAEKEMFTPASLLKVPLMMAYLKKAENNPAILKKKIVYALEQQEENDIIQNIAPKETLKIGEKYEVEELIKRMIVYSDNEAANLLLDVAANDFLANVYLDLGIEAPTLEKMENFMTVKEYASFFRILYNSSYLNRTMSEKALGFLSEIRYKGGLRAGIPDDVMLAHKFGERVFENIHQLHDCGIVYHDVSPYILCLMSRGDNFGNLDDVIKDISKNVYNEVDKE